jgi:hypothetical protein
MTDPGYMVLYPDEEGTPPDGKIFYPASLRTITPALTELNAEPINDIDVYSDNVGLEIDAILRFFIGVHGAHEAALQILKSYRNEGRQYCLYLRNFNWSGEYSSGELRLTAGDRTLKKFVAESLPRDVAFISFVNTFDGYIDNENNYGHDNADRGLIPSVRILTHNWQEIVREVILGARMVILNTRTATEGIALEANLLAECGMTGRTIIIGPGVASSGLFSANKFADIIDEGKYFLSSEPLADDVATRLTEAIHALSTDSLVQTKQVDDLSKLPCWVIDRNIADARKQFSAEKLAGVPYENYLPESLLNNWTAFMEQSPKMIAEWELLEKKFADASHVSESEILEALYQAVHVFHIATTVERYYEMAMALSIIGMAFKSVTGKFDMIMKCYAHAVKCAQWAGDSELSAFLVGALAHLRQEASQVD